MRMEGTTEDGVVGNYPLLCTSFRLDVEQLQFLFQSFSLLPRHSNIADWRALTPLNLHKESLFSRNTTPLSLT